MYVLVAVVALGAGGAYSYSGLWIRHRCSDHYAGCPSNLKNYATAIHLYTEEHGEVPRNLEALREQYFGGYDLPECHVAGRNTYRVDFGPNAIGNVHGFEDYYYIECTGTAHEEEGLLPNYPAYSARDGVIRKYL